MNFKNILRYRLKYPYNIYKNYKFVFIVIVFAKISIDRIFGPMLGSILGKIHKKRSVMPSLQKSTQEIPEYKRVMRYAYALLRIIRQKYGISLYTTSIHKLIYFTLAKFNDPLLRKTYRPYYYGPYSDDLTHALNILKETKYIKTESEKYGIFHSVSDKKAPPLPEEERQVLQVVEKLVSSVPEGQEILNDTTKLSEMAKTHFLWRFYPQLRTPQKLARRAQILGWKLSPERVESYLSILQNAGLLS